MAPTDHHCPRNFTKSWTRICRPYIIGLQGSPDLKVPKTPSREIVTLAARVLRAALTRDLHRNKVHLISFDNIPTKKKKENSELAKKKSSRFYDSVGRRRPKSVCWGWLLGYRSAQRDDEMRVSPNCKINALHNPKRVTAPNNFASPPPNSARLIRISEILIPAAVAERTLDARGRRTRASPSFFRSRGQLAKN